MAKLQGGTQVYGNLIVNAGLYTTTGLFWAGNNNIISTGGGGGSSSVGNTGQVQYNNGGVLGAAGIYYYSANTAIAVIGATTSTSTTTGQLQVLGGTGITGALYAGSVYDNGLRAVTTVNTTAGTGISLTSQTTTGSTTAVTITNSGVTSAVAGTGISVSGATGAVTITNSGVTGLSSSGTGNITVSASTGAVTLALPSTGPGAASVGSSTAIPVITTDAYGRVSATSTAVVVAPAGTLSGSTLASGVTASSLTSVGTLTSLAVGAVTSSGTVIASTVQAGTIGNTGALLTGTLQTASQTNITGVGTVTTGTWSASFGAVSGANLTSLTAGNLSGTIPSAVLANSTHYIGTTAIALNRGTGSQTLTGVSVDGNSATVGGFTPTATAGTANRVVVADANGYITNNYFHTTGGGSERNASGLGYFAGHNTSDYYIRSYTAAAAATLLSGQTMNIAGSATFVSSPDGDRNAATKLPTTSGNRVRFDFSSASSAGMAGGNYAGVMTYAPWDGTTASTGDASYQLGFGSTATNGSGYPQLNIRKGIDSTWNTWYNIFHAGQTNSPSADNTWNLGTASLRYATVYGVTFSGVSTTAKYADLAERYTSDAEYLAGTVVVFGGEQEITISTTSHDTAVAGIISTDPAYLMNSEATGLPVALTGRVPCRVQGPVRKGQLVVTSDTPGVAQAIDNSKFLPGCVIGKALEAINTNTIETIEVVVGRF